MLISFSLKNFKSFKEEMHLDFKPSRSKALKYSILQSGKHRALSTMVFYGANASGKSNLIKGLQTLKRYIQYGKVDEVMPQILNQISIHNFNTDLNEPVEFGIKFENEGEVYTYNLSLIMIFSGGKLEFEVGAEQLQIGNKVIFERIKNDLKGFKEADNLERGLLKGDLFLCNGYKLRDKNSYQNIYNWFTEKLLIYTQIDRFSLMDIDVKDKDIVNDIASAAGTCSNKIEIIDNKNLGVTPVSKIKNEYYSITVLSYEFESLGTVKLMSFLPYLIEGFKKGATVFVDELDSSLHPMAVINLINIFHNDEINKKRAQLAFTTHNPIYLEAEVFRSDEVYIVDKDVDGNSTISCITSKGRITKNSSILNMYMRNDFGGIPDIDFSNLFMTKDEETGNDGEDCNE